MTPFDRSQYGNSQVWVVILARNESATIRDVVESALPYAHGVAVMDGNSTDGTAEIARQAGAPVRQDPGSGKGSAIRMSLDVVPADVIVFMDADGSHHAADIPRLAMPVVHGETDLCVGSRYTGGSDELSVSFGQLIRSIGNISMNVAINNRWHTALSDTLNGFRAVRRSAALGIGLRENRHTIEQEMVMKMLRHGFRVSNVPAHEYPRRHGASHIRIWREWPLFVWCVVRNLVARDIPRPASQPASMGSERVRPDRPVL